MANNWITHLEPIMSRLLRDPVLDVALRQRAKFENWLKIELASALAQTGYTVRLEESYSIGPRQSYRADIMVANGQDISLIMLKTVNTNFRFPGVENHSRPITKNIAGVIEDMAKLTLRPAATAGYALFVTFPVASHRQDRDNQLQMHINRIWKQSAQPVASGFVPRHPEWGLTWHLITQSLNLSVSNLTRNYPDTPIH
jgi:hypothetical protein